jgi:hypothetical protein
MIAIALSLTVLAPLGEDNLDFDEKRASLLLKGIEKRGDVGGGS